MIHHHNEKSSDSIFGTFNILQTIYSIFVTPTAEQLFQFLCLFVQMLKTEMHNS